MQIDPKPLSPDDVAGFDASIVTIGGQPAGICLKLRRLDGRDHVLHLRPLQSSRLVRAIEQYIEQGDHQALMVLFHEDPRLTADLSEQHPYNTLLSMWPKLGEEETGNARRSTDVEESTFTGKGPFVIYRVKFVSGETSEFRLHECVAFNIWGFLTKMVNDADMLLGRPGGSA